MLHCHCRCCLVWSGVMWPCFVLVGVCGAQLNCIKILLTISGPLTLVGHSILLRVYDPKKRWMPTMVFRLILALAWLGWFGLPRSSLAWLSCLTLPSNNNSHGTQHQHPPKVGGLLLLLGSASQAERQARPRHGNPSKPRQG